MDPDIGDDLAWFKDATDEDLGPVPLNSGEEPTTAATNAMKDGQLDPELRRVYIVGLGAVAQFIAHALRETQQPPPVTLLTTTLSKYRQWKSSNQEISLIDKGQVERRRGYECEFTAELDISDIKTDDVLDPLGQQRRQGSTQGRQEHSSGRTNTTGPSRMIRHLIVTVKAPYVRAALLGLRSRLTRDSTLLLVQNGMGIVEDLNEHVWPDAATRPNYMLGIVTHGLSAEWPFTVSHNRHGTLALGIIPRGEEPVTKSIFFGSGDTRNSDRFTWQPTSRYILRLLTSLPRLGAVGYGPSTMLFAKLERLAVAAIIEPVTALLDGPNGALLFNYSVTRAMRLLIAEVSLVLRSLPELRGLPLVSTRFGAVRLETLVVAMANRTATTTSPTLNAMRRGLRTEIEYTAGYIIRRGEKLGIHCSMTFLLMQLVLGKASMISRERNDYLPLDKS